MNRFDEEEGNNWWLKKLTKAPPKQKNQKVGRNRSDLFCLLKYCVKCDRLWEVSGRSGGRTYVEYFDRADLSFYGFVNDRKKYKICMKCKQEELDD